MYKQDLLTLLARVIIGGIFVYAGWLKVSDMATTVAMLQQMGLNEIIAYLVSYGELVLGALLALGFYAQIATGGLMVIMAGAIYYSWGMGFQGYSIPLGLFGGLASLLGTGPGSYTIRFGR